MSRVANATRFGDNGVGGSWYDPPMPVSESGTEMWRARAAWLNTTFPTGKIGIAGTGFAWTQYWLFVDYSRQSWGCDVSWAATKAGVNLGAWASFVGAHDVLVPSQMTTFRRMGNTGQAKYDILFTEDLLPCAESEAEVATMLTNLRTVGIQLVHLITPLIPDVQQTADMLWRTHAQWRTLIGPTDIIVGPDLIEV